MIRILVVTCDREQTDSIVLHFNSLEGIEAQGACSESEGLRIFDEEGAVNLLIVEVCNPAMAGTKLILKLRRRMPSLPCIALSGYEEKETQKFLENQGILRYLRHPIPLDRLESTVESLLDEARSLGFQGQLKHISLIEVIQLYCATGKTGRLDILHWGKRGAIYFANGSIIHAVQEELEGQEAFYRLVRWDSGTFRVEFDVLPSRDTLSHESWHALLIEAIRRQDEAVARDGNGRTKGARIPATPPRKSHMSGSASPPKLELVEVEPRSRRRQPVLKAWLVDQLLEIDGVEGLLVVNRNGVVLQTEDVDDSEETLGTLTTFLGSSCESTAEVMGADRFTTALIVERSQRKLLVVNTRNFFIGVIGSAHIQVDPLTRGVLSCVRKAAVSGRTRQNKPVHDSSMDNSRESNSSDMLCPAQTSETGVAVSEDKEAKE